jgi:hypothetical protein
MKVCLRYLFGYLVAVYSPLLIAQDTPKPPRPPVANALLAKDSEFKVIPEALNREDYDCASSWAPIHFCLDKKYSPSAKTILKNALAELYKASVSTAGAATCLSRVGTGLRNPSHYLELLNQVFLPGTKGEEDIDDPSNVKAYRPIYVSRFKEDLSDRYKKHAVFAYRYFRVNQNGRFSPKFSIGVNQEYIESLDNALAQNPRFWAAMFLISLAINYGVSEDMSRFDESPSHQAASCLLGLDSLDAFKSLPLEDLR